MVTDETLLQVTVLQNGKGGGVIAGPDHIITSICRQLGFKHRGNRVFLTAAKMARLGLADAEGVSPNWRQLTADQLRAAGWGQ
jgi:hypothetical protein